MLILFSCVLCVFNNVSKVCAETNFTDNKAIANVINENEKSEVYLTYNEYDETNSYKTNIKIIIKTNSQVQEILTDNLCGFNPTMFLGDFLGNGLSQIMLVVYNNLGEPFVIIYSLDNGEIKPIFNLDNFNDANNVMLTNNNDLLYLNVNETSFIIDNLTKNELNYNITKYKVLPYYNIEQNKYNLIVVNKLEFYSEQCYFILNFIDLNLEESRIIKSGITK